MVSVIIPTLNAAPVMANLLESLRNQTIPVEIIIIDSSSHDGTVNIALSYGARVLTILREEFGHGKTRNLAAREVSGDVMVFLTQDALPRDGNCIENLVAPLGDPGIAASYGRQIPQEGAKPPERFVRQFNYPPDPSIKSWKDISSLGIKTFFFSNVCSAVRREEFEHLGGFPEDLVMFEDMLFAAKLLKDGYSVAYVPGAEVIHSHDYSWQQQFKRYAKAGISFSNNPWFLEYAKAGEEGLSLFRKEVRYFLENRMYYWCLYAFGDALFKYIGFNLGLRHRSLPQMIAKRVTGYLNG